MVEKRVGGDAMARQIFSKDGESEPCSLVTSLKSQQISIDRFVRTERKFAWIPEYSPRRWQALQREYEFIVKRSIGKLDRLPKICYTLNLEWKRNNIPAYQSVPWKRKDSVHTYKGVCRRDSGLTRGMRELMTELGCPVPIGCL